MKYNKDGSYAERVVLIRTTGWNSELSKKVAEQTKKIVKEQMKKAIASRNTND
jgi:hypothetical protein